MNKKVYLTRQGLKGLQGEFDKLVNKKRPLLVERVKKAREMGDLSENTEYTNAREELNMLDGRIEELEQILSRARIIKGKTKKEVGLGCKVTLKTDGRYHIYTVVGEWEADPLEKKISHSSPLGKALMGKKLGEKVEIKAPAGRIIYEVKKIH